MSRAASLALAGFCVALAVLLVVSVAPTVHSVPVERVNPITPVTTTGPTPTPPLLATERGGR